MTDTVLIVDDSLTVRMDLQEAFDAAGFGARACATLADARTALAEHPADVLVLDVLLPDGDGVELLEEVRASPAAAKAVVLMLSSEAEVKDRWDLFTLSAPVPGADQSLEVLAPTKTENNCTMPA